MCWHRLQPGLWQMSSGAVSRQRQARLGAVRSLTAHCAHVTSTHALSHDTLRAFQINAAVRTRTRRVDAPALRRAPARGKNKQAGSGRAMAAATSKRV